MENSICICGAGTMGRGIAQAAAAAGIHTILFDLNEDALKIAEQDIETNLDKQVSRLQITDEHKKEILDHLQLTNNLSDCLAGFIIEAIIEKPEAKIALFNQLAEINHSESIFATNTSSLSVSKIAAEVKNPERMIGMHFFNPATIMKLVEVVRTEWTNQQTIERTIELAVQMGKTPVLCTDAPGFIVNRVARPFYIESLRLVEEGVADFSFIDKIMESSGFRMGPFRLMDLIGNDVNYEVSCSVYEQMGKPERFKPSDIQKEKVGQGKLGRKTGEGYYKYNK